MKMKTVYEANPALGDPMSIEGKHICVPLVNIYQALTWNVFRSIERVLPTIGQIPK